MTDAGALRSGGDKDAVFYQKTISRTCPEAARIGKADNRAFLLGDNMRIARGNPAPPTACHLGDVGRFKFI